MVLPLKRYAQFTGRASRKEYWAFSLFYVAAVLIAVVLGSDEDEVDGLFFLLLLPLLVPGIVVAVRRLHDQGKSGWLSLISLVPVVSIVFLVLMVMPGTPGDNQYGPDSLLG